MLYAVHLETAQEASTITVNSSTAVDNSHNMLEEKVHQDFGNRNKQMTESRIDESSPARLWCKGKHISEHSQAISNGSDRRLSKFDRAKLAIGSLFKRIASPAHLPNGEQEVEHVAPVSTFGLLDLPMDIWVIIFEHLDHTDREILRYVCRAFYHGIPAFDFQQDNGRCIQSRVFRRLLDSSLLPNVQRSGRYLTKLEIKKRLETHKTCDFCTSVCFPGSRMYCPFHKPVGEFVVPPLFPLNDRRNFLRLDYIRWALRARRAVTAEEYRMVALTHTNRVIIPPPQTYLYSWEQQLSTIEDEYLAADAYQEVEGERPRELIVKLYCCCHCYHVLPRNDPLRPCNWCECTFCGSTDVDFIRSEDWGGQVQYTALGKIHELPKKKGYLRAIR